MITATAATTTISVRTRQRGSRMIAPRRQAVTLHCKAKISLRCKASPVKVVARPGQFRPPSLRRHNGAMRHDRPETVTASEIANWVYCPEAWRLDALGLPSANQQERDGGDPPPRREGPSRADGRRSDRLRVRADRDGRACAGPPVVAPAMSPWILAVLALIIGLALVLRGRGMRSRRGLGQGRTLDLDSRNLYSAGTGSQAGPTGSSRAASPRNGSPPGGSTSAGEGREDRGQGEGQGGRRGKSPVEGGLIAPMVIDQAAPTVELRPALAAVTRRRAGPACR